MYGCTINTDRVIVLYEIWLKQAPEDSRPIKDAGIAPRVLGAFILRGIKSKEINTGITGMAQSATCCFCKKTVCTWRERTTLKRANRRWNASVPKELQKARDKHTPDCAEQWMWELLCRWSIGLASPQESQAIEIWREKYMRVYDPDSERWNSPFIPWYDRCPEGMEKIFDSLPQPMGSDMAHHLEMGLILLSQLPWAD